MFSSADIHTVTDFSRKPAEHIKRLMESKRPDPFYRSHAFE